MPDTQVFISYAHTRADTALAKCAAAALRSVGIGVWLDEATLSGGDLLQNAIEKAIATSQHGVFLVSPSWINREWTQFELEQFARRDPNVVRRIPIFRAPRRDMVVPPALVRVTGFQWLEDDQDVDSRLWELYCAVTDTPPGPSEAWAEQWRGLPKRGPAPSRPVVSTPNARLRPSLRCNRAVQWSAVDELAVDSTNELIVIPGCVGQAHDHFVERIQRLLRLDPPRSMVTVDWPTRPRSRDEYLEALGRALDVAPTAIAGEFAERLAYNNLLLLHPCVRTRFADESLVKYYTEWLPDVIEQARADMKIKCVQPIEFPADKAGRSLLAWFRVGTPPVDTRAGADTLMTTLRSSTRSVFRTIRLRDLTDVTQDDLTEFSDFCGLTATQRAWLLAQIEARNAVLPKDIFQALDDCLPDARSMA